MPNGEFGTFDAGNALLRREQIIAARQANQQQNILAQRATQFNPLLAQHLQAGQDGALQGGDQNVLAQMFALDPERAIQAQEFQQTQVEQQFAQDQQEADQIIRGIQVLENSASPSTLLPLAFPEFTQGLEDQGIDLSELTDERIKNELLPQLKAQFGPVSSFSLEELDMEDPFGEPPTGFKRTPEGDLEFIPGGPQDPDLIAQQTQARRIPKDLTGDMFKRTNTLVTEARKDKRIDDHIEVSNALLRVEAAGDTAAGDVALIFAFMRALDPASTVREGEFATAQNSVGISGRIRAAYNNALTGQRLTPELRADFKQQARNLAVETETSARTALEGIRPRAKAFGVNFSLIEQSIFPLPADKAASELTDDELLEELGKTRGQ